MTMHLAAKLAAAPLLAGLALTALADTVHKYRQGEHVVYQSSPCPVGYESLPIAPPATDPDRTAVARARAMAKADLAAAERLRQREAREEAKRRKREVAAERQALACARLLEVIRTLESPTAHGVSDRHKGPRQAISERKAYIRRCGPLPR